MAGKICLLFD